MHLTDVLRYSNEPATVNTASYGYQMKWAETRRCKDSLACGFIGSMKASGLAGPCEAARALARIERRRRAGAAPWTDSLIPLQPFRVDSGAGCLLAGGVEQRDGLIRI